MIVAKGMTRDELAFLEGKTLSQAVMLVDKLQRNYRVRVYSVDRIMTEDASKTRGACDPNRVNVRIKEGRIFEVLGRG